MMMPEAGFVQARKIWLRRRENEMNVQVGFVLAFDASQADGMTLAVTGSSLYKIYVNGEFVHYGPARGPHGRARIDSLALNGYLRDGANNLAIEVAGYRCNSYYTLNQPSFLQAELVRNGKVFAATAEDGPFRAVELTCRVRKAMRYSFQRTFTEIYHIDGPEAADGWRLREPSAAAAVAEVRFDTDYLGRGVPVPAYAIRPALRRLASGRVERLPRGADTPYIRKRYIDQISDVITGYPLEEIAERPFETLQDLKFCPAAGEGMPDSAFPAGNVRQRPDSAPGAIRSDLGEREYVLLDMGLNNNGFIRLELTASADCELLAVFDEKLIGGRIALETWESVNVLSYSLKRSDLPYRLESFETYGFRYLALIVLKGSVRLENVGLRELAYPHDRNSELACPDGAIAAIFEAAVQTYRQNTLDVFMDCPTRERAGWLCDSYFTAQAAQYFSGEALVERAMLENYALAQLFPNIPAGMLPMCYPADHANGRFIPQWAMWYVIELEGYFKRSKEADPARFQALCYGLVRYLQTFRNEDGLLERLDGWNFIEWSDANRWVQDVNYPTNMLYSKMLRLIGGWYGDDLLRAEAEAVRRTVIEQAFDGEFFADRAVRDEHGRLQVVGDRSEVCQYYALFFGMIDPADPRCAKLMHTVLNVFGPERRERGLLPEIAYANAFIGYYLRMEVLLCLRRYGQVLEECKGYFGKMAETTGTLWEHGGIEGSLNHGFASYAGVAILRCMLGVQEINVRDGAVTLDFGEIGLDRASGRIGTSLGDIVVRRETRDGRTVCRIAVPRGWEVKWLTPAGESAGLDVQLERT